MVGHLDLATARHCLDGVFQQVDHDLPQRVGSGRGFAGLILQPHDDLHRGRHEPGLLEQGDDACGDPVHIGGAAAGRHCRLQVGESVDNMADAVDLVVQDRHFTEHRLVAQQFHVEHRQVVLDDGQRIVDFMRDPARGVAIVAGKAGSLLVTFGTFGRQASQCRAGLGGKGLQEAFALLQVAQLLLANAADQDCRTTAAACQRQGHQGIGAQHAQQLFFTDAQQGTAPFRIGRPQLPGCQSNRIAGAVERDGKFGQAQPVRTSRTAGQCLPGRIHLQHDRLVEAEQDARRADHGLAQFLFALASGKRLASIRRQHQVAYFFGQTLAREFRRRSWWWRRRRHRRLRRLGASQVDAQVIGGTTYLQNGALADCRQRRRIDATQPAGIDDGSIVGRQA